MSKFVISCFKQGYYFELKTAKGEVLLTSNTFESGDQCEAEVVRAVKHSQKKHNFTRHKVDESKHFFCLNDTKGEVIGSSENYVTFAGVRKAIRAVRKHSVMAQVIRE